MRIGVILRSFERDLAPALSQAVEAEEAGIDGVFAYDHLWPMRHPGEPAIDPFALLGRISSATDRLVLGTLVARVGLVADAVLVDELLTLSRLRGGRFVAGLGTGDHKSADEERGYGIPRRSAAERRASLEAVGAALVDVGVEVWVGAGARSTNAVCRRIGATLNLYDVPPDTLARAASDGPVSWGGSLPTDPAGAAGRLRALAAAGASWAAVSWPGPPSTLAAVAGLAGIEKKDR